MSPHELSRWAQTHIFGIDKDAIGVPASVCRTEREAPPPDRFVGYREPAWGQEVFGIAKAHTEVVIQSDGVAHDLGEKSISMIARRVALQRPSLPRSR